uniref:Putative Sec14 protein n=1 Tax=Cryptococcus neoformans TaxID=5207 RepID=F6K8L6_CRYNE|nr:putative Sec14 protein [Cryptococcus neoformans var. grubii]
MSASDPLSGHPGHLSAAQETALKEFRQQLTSEELIPADWEALVQRIEYNRFDDQTLLRFLRARKFDLPKAKLMWANNEKWRKQFGADEIAANGFDYPEQSQVVKYYPQFYHKTDNDGRPVYIEQLGKLDINKLYAITTQDRQLKRLVSEYEKFLRDRLPASSKMMGHLVETSCTILDLNNAGISTFYKGIFEISTRRARQSNAPYLFSTVWSLIKPWLDEATVRKIHILGKNYKPELLQYIPAENLPADLGDTATAV